MSRASQLIRLREQFQQTANVSKSRLGALIPLMFANPFLTVRRVERATGLTNQGARNLIRAAERQGWCESIGSIGQGGREYWVAREVWLITEAEPTYE